MGDVPALSALRHPVVSNAVDAHPSHTRRPLDGAPPSPMMEGNPYNNVNMRVSAIAVSFSPLHQTTAFYPEQPAGSRTIQEAGIAMNGVMRAIIDDTRDPQGRGRVRVRVPGAMSESSMWAGVVSPVMPSDSENDSGFAPGDEVLVAFESGDVRHPYVLGTLSPRKDTSPKHRPNPSLITSGPVAPPAGRPRPTEPPGHDKPIEIIDKSGKNSVVIDPATNTVTVTGSQTVVLQGQKVRIDARDIELKGEATISLDAPVIKVNASASLEASAGAVLTIQGALVRIN